MFWDGRKRLAGLAVLAVLAGLGMVGGGAVFWTVRHLSAKPTVVSAINAPGVAMPILSQSGSPLTHRVSKSVLLVSPRRVPNSRRQALKKAIGVRTLATRPFLWFASSARASSWSSVRGIVPVRARINIPKKNIPDGMVLSLAVEAEKGQGSVWHWSNDQYSPSGPPLKTSLSVSLQTAIGNQDQGAGSVVVINNQGQVVAALGSNKGPNRLWSGHPVGLAELPPLMALALGNSSVRNSLPPGASLAKIADVWGMSRFRAALDALGFSQPSLFGEQIPGPSLPGHLSPQAFSQGAQLYATALELARSYLPFVDEGRISSLSLLTAPQPLAHSVAGDFGAVLRDMPQITQSHRTFRVWRPAGYYAVILEPSPGLVAVLQGAATKNTLAVAKAMANLK